MKSKEDDSQASEGIRWLGKITFNPGTGKYDYTPFEESGDRLSQEELEEILENPTSSDSL